MKNRNTTSNTSASGHDHVTAAGANPSNTAPANYDLFDKADTRILKYGIDSLYLSYKGNLNSNFEKALRAKKDSAQSSDRIEQATAQITLANQRFIVEAYGRRAFSYVLRNGQYDIAVSSEIARQLPLATVQLRSELIHSIGIKPAEAALWEVLRTLCENLEGPNISRVDIYVDFVTDVEFPLIVDPQWVTQARRIDRYRIGGVFTGWSFGKGDLSARLYNKSQEVKASGKDWFREYWRRAGWDGETEVWRLEFQFRRERLKSFGARALDEIHQSVPELWRYAMENWLRLVVPQKDGNRTRWPTHTLWKQLSAIPWGDEGPPIYRPVLQTMLPGDEALFVRGLWPLTSYMAREGLTDYGDAMAAYLRHAEDYFRREKLIELQEYIFGKVLQKGRLYNSLVVESLTNGEFNVRKANADDARDGR